MTFLGREFRGQRNSYTICKTSICICKQIRLVFTVIQIRNNPKCQNNLSFFFFFNSFSKSIQITSLSWFQAWCNSIPQILCSRNNIFFDIHKYCKHTMNTHLSHWSRTNVWLEAGWAVITSEYVPHFYTLSSPCLSVYICYAGTGIY